MSLSDTEISRIIERVTQEVGQKMKIDEQSDGAETTVVLIPGFVPSPKKALASIQEHYGSDVTLILLGGAGIESNGIGGRQLDWPKQANELIELLVGAKHAVLLAPGTGLLLRMGGGQDENGVGEALLRRILWGKPVDVLLDFEPPKFRCGTYFAQIAEAVDTLSSMGVRFFTYQPTDRASTGACSLLTERDVIDAKNSGQKTLVCLKEAIITPLAADTARELQIHIEYV